MEDINSSKGILEMKRDLESALERKDLDTLEEYLHDDFSMEMLGVKLEGKEGARKGFNWFLRHVESIKIVPLKVVSDENSIFEEMEIHSVLRSGKKVTSKQSEVLDMEDGKIKSLRLYFDRMDFADAVIKGPMEKKIVEIMLKRSLDGL